MNKRGHTLRVTVDVPEARLGKLIVELSEKGYAVQTINIVEEVPFGRNTGGVTAREIILDYLRKKKTATTSELKVELARFGKTWPAGLIVGMIKKEKTLKKVGRSEFGMTAKGEQT